VEQELDWLPGFAGSRPVRIGNEAAGQFQLDVYGEVMDAMHQARCSGLAVDEDAWRLQQALVGYVESNWTRPDDGLWEVRSGRQHFTHSKVMAWAAFDRAATAVTHHRLPGDAVRWRTLADEVHAQVCAEAFDAELGAFTQAYGSKALDASTLLIPLVGFLPADDPRVRATVDAIERELTVDGLVLRYRAKETDDGLFGEEATFTVCSFWLVSALAAIGEGARARQLLDRLLGLASPLGLYAEELDPRTGRHWGNFPQAYTHLGVIEAILDVTD